MGASFHFRVSERLLNAFYVNDSWFATARVTLGF